MEYSRPLSRDSDEPCDIFVHDPEVPVLAPGGAHASSGQFDQAVLELGNNLLVYTTEPLTHSLWIFGIPRVALHCTTSAARADFTAKLVRVRPRRRRRILVHRHRALKLALSRNRIQARTKFIVGNSPWNPPRAVSRQATGSGWKSPAARFPSTTAIPALTCLPAALPPGTGSAQPRSCITATTIPRLSICR